MNYKSISFLIVLFLSISLTHMLKARFNLKNSATNLLAVRQDEPVRPNVFQEVIDKVFPKQNQAVANQDVTPASFLQTNSQVGQNVLDVKSLKNVANRQIGCFYLSNACDFYSGTVTKYCLANLTNPNLVQYKAKSFIVHFKPETQTSILSRSNPAGLDIINASRNTAIENDEYLTNCYLNFQEPFQEITLLSYTPFIARQILVSQGPTKTLAGFIPKESERANQLYALIQNPIKDCNYGELRTSNKFYALISFPVGIIQYDPAIRTNILNFINSWVGSSSIAFAFAVNNDITLSSAQSSISLKVPANRCQLNALGALTNLTVEEEKVEVNTCD